MGFAGEGTSRAGVEDGKRGIKVEAVDFGRFVDGTDSTGGNMAERNAGKKKLWRQSCQSL